MPGMNRADTSRTAVTRKNNMSDTRTTSILQRVPVILAVTAASYGLTLPLRNDVQPQEPQKTQQQQHEKAPRR